MAKFKVQRQDNYTDCDHANPRQCHALDPDGSRPQHRYWTWHLVDPATGQPTDDGPWYSAAEAREFRDRTV